MAADSPAGADVLPTALQDRDLPTAAQIAASAAAFRLRTDVDAGRRPADAELAAVVAFADRVGAQNWAVLLTWWFVSDWGTVRRGSPPAELSGPCR